MTGRCSRTCRFVTLTAIWEDWRVGGGQPVRIRSIYCASRQKTRLVVQVTHPPTLDHPLSGWSRPDKRQPYCYTECKCEPRYLLSLLHACNGCFRTPERLRDPKTQRCKHGRRKGFDKLRDLHHTKQDRPFAESEHLGKQDGWRTLP